jgi:hypothetical protein
MESRVINGNIFSPMNYCHNRMMRMEDKIPRIWKVYERIRHEILHIRATFPTAVPPWCHYPNNNNYYYRYSALGQVRAETRAQSGDWYGSGTLHPWQILRGSLPLLSPAFRRSHFRHQVPPRPPRRLRFQWRKVELWARILLSYWEIIQISVQVPVRRNLIPAFRLRRKILVKLKWKLCSAEWSRN